MPKLLENKQGGMKNFKNLNLCIFFPFIKKKLGFCLHTILQNRKDSKD